MNRTTKQHIEFLDPLRGLAILLVFAYHALGAAFGMYQLPWGSGWFRDFHLPASFLAVAPASLGWLGVALFFVISGFCIHLSFSKRTDWPLFFQRRFFRIYPPYVVALCLFLVLHKVTKTHGVVPEDGPQILGHLALVHNLDPRWLFGINPSFWSIALEVQLYLLYPLLLALVARLGWQRTLLGLAGLEITLRLADGFALTAYGEGLPQWIIGSPLSYWLSWSLGAFVAERYLQGARLTIPRMALVGCGAAALATTFFKPLSSLSFLLFSLATAGVIGWWLEKPEARLRLPQVVWNHLGRVGVWSFSLYLLHQPLLAAVSKVAGKFAASQPLFVFAGCLAAWFAIVPAARFFYQFCELPSVALGKYVQNLGLSIRVREFVRARATTFATLDTPAGHTATAEA